MSNISHTHLEVVDGVVTRVWVNGAVIWPQPLATDAAESHTVGRAREAAYMDQHRDKVLGANERQEGGTHYQSPDVTGVCPHCRKEVQHWDVAASLRGLEYAATKYLWRWRDKDSFNSLKKALHYIQKLIEIHFPTVGVNITFHYNGDKPLSGAYSARPAGGTKPENAAGQEVVERKRYQDKVNPNQDKF